MGSSFPSCLPRSGVEHSGLREGQARGALTSALPTRFSRARTWVSENCFLQRGPEGSLVEGCRHSGYFIIPLPGAIREMLNLSKNSASCSPPSFSTQLPPSALLSILSGVTTATSRTGWPHPCLLPASPPPPAASPALRGQGPPPTEMCISRALTQNVRASTP